MAATTTTVTGPIETLGGSALSGKYIRFTLLTSGTETATGDLVAASTTSELLDANGDFSATLWVNGESGVESIYRIEIPGDTLAYDVIIPTSAGGGSISVETLIENHQVTGSLQQSTTLSQATAYTDSELDAFAIDPATAQVNFNATNWLVDLGVENAALTTDNETITGAWTFDNVNGFAVTYSDVGSDGAGVIEFGTQSGNFDSWMVFGEKDQPFVIQDNTGAGPTLTLSHEGWISVGASGNVTPAEFGLLSGAETVVSGGITDNDSAVPTSAAVLDLVYAPVTSVTATTYTVLSSDRILLCNNASGVTVTLLASATAGDGFTVTIKNVGSAGSVTIDGNASETIDGGLTAVLTSQYESLTIVCDGSNWNII